MRTNPLILARKSVGCKQTTDFFRQGNISRPMAYKTEDGFFSEAPKSYLLALIIAGYPAADLGQLKLDYLEWLEERKAEQK